MKTVEISYNPYKMITKMLIDGIDVCTRDSYVQFKDFIENAIPLQTWIEPVGYLDWKGFVNEVSDPDYNDEVKIIFSGRKIDFEDLKRSIADQNEERSKETRVIYHYQHKKVLDDKILSKNIEDVVSELKSDRFRELIDQRTTEGLTEKYNALEENYRIAKENVFYIVFAGVYSSGKSTLLNTIMRHDILPTSVRTCTSKNCRIRHDGSLGNKISLACYGAKNEESGIEPLIIKKKVYETDEECAAAFLKICPIKGNGIEGKFQDVETMEIGVDLSHLYPASVKKENFTIVLMDTPGMDSAQSSEDGNNRHAEIALDAISMENKPMIILCVDASKFEDKNIGEFMREIINQSKEDGSGFNDRFMFLMNKSDSVPYTQNDNAESVKMAFAEYLTDCSKWNINEDDLKQLAEAASRFVPRIFMTSGIIANAIQRKVYDFTEEEREDEYKDEMYKTYNNFEDKICKKRTNFYLAKYCDIPNYRKDEIDIEFDKAIATDNKVRATELQCGLVSVETAIKDYIERYAYPIKVRGLLDTFEDILEDVNGFTSGVLADLNKAKRELGEKHSERKEVIERKESVNEKIAALKDAERNVYEQLKNLDKISFDAVALKKAMGEFRADIEDDKDIVFIRKNPRVMTGTKSRYEVEAEINDRAARIQRLFDRTLRKTNEKLEEIKSVHDRQLGEIFSLLKSVVVNLENSGIFKQGEYKFTDSVLWKMNFFNIDSESFIEDLKKKIIDRSVTLNKVRNRKKEKWSSSWNPLKKIRAWFMDEYENIPVDVEGYYETTYLRQSIEGYLQNLTEQSDTMKKNFEAIINDSKAHVNKLIAMLLRELKQFIVDIEEQKKRIEELGGSISRLNNEIQKKTETHNWLNNLKKKIEGE